MVGRINNMYLINAPAGSGKTTYIENTIIDLLAKHPNIKILSITYTNRAKEELKARVDNENVTIDTIHSFLSSFISLYLSKIEVIDLYLQEFKDKIESLIDKGGSDSKNARYIEKYGELNFETIRKNIKQIYYNEQSFSSYYYGGLSHDDMISFCRKMFEKFPILKKRLSHKYAYIFIDEYQDTSADVLNIFYQSILDTNSELYLLGDKMQEIYSNYDGSFNKILSTFNQDQKLAINYRCSSAIIDVLNNLYNDTRYFQIPNGIHGGNAPTVLITDISSEKFIGQYQNHMQLYLFNRERFEKIGIGDLYCALSDMKAYRFPSQYTPTDVLTDKTNDNPDKLFRALLCICEFVEFIDRKAYGKSIHLAREKSQIFNRDLTNIRYHDEKIAFSTKVIKLREESKSLTATILEFCKFLIANEYCLSDAFLPFIENEEYQKVLNTPVQQLILLYSYLEAPKISTQHGVKGEGHDEVCFISEDSKQNPIVYMYDFLRLLCTNNINLTDFQNFYYDYKSVVESVDLTYLSPAKVYKDHKEEYIKKAQFINDKYQDDKYFAFCQQEQYSVYLNNPTSTNAKDCFKSTKTKGVLWAYKLFYVGCSRAKKNLTVIVDENKIAPFRKEFIEKMTSIGFCFK